MAAFCVSSSVTAALAARVAASSSSSSTTRRAPSSAVAPRAPVRSGRGSTSLKAVAEPSAGVKALPFRVGHGFDLHRLELLSEMPDLRLILGGIQIDHDRGCVAGKRV